jgi:hypothetical protein
LPNTVTLKNKKKQQRQSTKIRSQWRIMEW